MLRAMGKRFPGQVLLYGSATVFQGLVAILIIPLMTLRLGPEEYGLYGLVMSVVALAVACSDSGGSIVLAAAHGSVDAEQHRRMVGTLLAASAVQSFVLACALFAALPTVLEFAGASISVSTGVILLAAVLVPLRAWNQLLLAILIVTRRTPWFAAAIALQAVGSAAGQLIGLFVLDLGAMSLLLGVVVGAALSAALGCIAATTVGIGVPSFSWFRKICAAAPAAISAALVDSIRVLAEGVWVARILSAGHLGYLHHARLYHSLFLQASNAVAAPAWPVALSEAREADGRFEKVHAAWTPVHIMLACGGVFFACVGEEVLNLLTNGKFVEAAWIVPLLLAGLLLQNSGKPATAVMFASQRGGELSYVRAGIVALIVVMMVPVLEFWGLEGFVGLMIAEFLLYRAYLVVRVRFIRTIPFQDNWVLIGIVLITVTFAVFQTFEVPFLFRVATLAGILALIALTARGIVASTLRQLGNFSG